MKQSHRPGYCTNINDALSEHLFSPCFQGRQCYYSSSERREPTLSGKENIQHSSETLSSSTSNLSKILLYVRPGISLARGLSLQITDLPVSFWSHSPLGFSILTQVSLCVCVFIALDPEVCVWHWASDEKHKINPFYFLSMVNFLLFSGVSSLTLGDGNDII